MIPGAKPAGAISINRDPFARSETTRARDGTGSCDWCGREGRLFAYGTETDGGRYFPIRGRFCSKGCMTDYNH